MNENANRVVHRNPYGALLKEGFIGIAQYPDTQEIHIHLHCTLYPKLLELRNTLDGVRPLIGPIPADSLLEMSTDQLRQLVMDMATASQDPRDVKRFFVGTSPERADRIHGDTMIHKWGPDQDKIGNYSIDLGRRTISGLETQVAFYHAFVANFSLSELRKFSTFLAAITQMQKSRLTKIPIKFIDQWDEERPGFGWVA